MVTLRVYLPVSEAQRVVVGTVITLLSVPRGYVFVGGGGGGVCISEKRRDVVDIDKWMVITWDAMVVQRFWLCCDKCSRMLVILTPSSDNLDNLVS